MFEGCDRVGKSTQVLQLLEALTKTGVPNKVLKFPGKCMYTVHEYNDDCEINL